MSKRNWILRLKCEVTKEIECEDCTEEQARADPWEHAVGDEIEIEQIDWEVIDIRPSP